MTDHLPECPHSNSRTVTFYGGYCVCPLLRACEQRVRLEDDDYAYVAAQAEADGRRRGWSEALDAAREAVARLQHKPGASIANAVSVIDALSENPDDLPVSENPNDAR